MPAVGTAAFSTLPSAQALPAPEVVSLLFVFDLGQTYLTPPGFAWKDVGSVWAAGSRWSVGSWFPSDIRPPLRMPIGWEPDPNDPRLKEALVSAPWCALESARFLFFLEGVAVLRVRARLKEPAAACKAHFDTWEDERRDGQEPVAYQRFPPVIEAAGQAFRALAGEARLRPAFPERDNRYKFDWIYPLFFSAGEALYGADELLHKAPLAFADSTIWVAWRGAHVGPSLQDREAVEAAFLAAALAWQSLHTLNTFLGGFLQELTLRQETEQPIPTDRIRSIRAIQFFSSHLLDASRPLRWTVMGSILGVLKALDQAWETRELRESIGTQTGLAGLLTLHYEKIEASRAEEEKQRREAVQASFQLVALVITLLTVLDATKTALDLFDPNKVWIRENWQRGVLALAITALGGLVSLLVWWKYRRRKSRSR